MSLDFTETRILASEHFYGLYCSKQTASVLRYNMRSWVGTDYKNLKKLVNLFLKESYPI